MSPVKYCQECGKVIAHELDCDYYRYIRLRYCPDCAADVKRRQKADYMRRLRASRSEQHRLTEEQNGLLKAENEMLRQRIRQLETIMKR